MAEPLRVGIIGANARGGWAAESHVPAVHGLEGLVLAAVATTRQETAGVGPHVPDPFVYLEDPAAFANLVTIQGAHTLDLVTALGGTLAGPSALASRQFPEVWTGDDVEPRPRETFDHENGERVTVDEGELAALPDAALPDAALPDAALPDAALPDAALPDAALPDAALPDAALPDAALPDAALPDAALPDAALPDAALPDAAVNVAGVYAALRDDIVRGTTTSPGFDHAVRLTRTIEAVLRSSDEGRFLTAEAGPV